jgi:hypothetical protein
MKNKKALVDADLIVYRIGSVGDGNYYSYRGERYKNLDDIKKVLALEGVKLKEVRSQISQGKDPLPWGEVEKILIDFLEEILSDYTDYDLFLSGLGNFRYSLATILPYKGNRSSIERPVHYDRIRQFLVETYEATISIGMEADDAIGLAQSDSTVIVTADKDLKVIPGLHRHIYTKEVSELSETASNRYFFNQLLTGDTTDNILGLYGVGGKSTYCKSINSMDDTKDMIDLVVDQYKCRFGSYWRFFLSETVQLVWILQKRRCPIYV